LEVRKCVLLEKKELGEYLGDKKLIWAE